MNYQPSAKLIKRLNDCIKIKSTKINRRTSVAQQVNFRLDWQLIAEIEQIRASNSKLELDSKNLTILRHYALQNLPLESICCDLDRQSPEIIYSDSALTFATQYSANQNQPHVTLVRSAIDLEGKIFQQVQKQLCQDTQLLEQISQAHYWLVLEILAQLPLRSRTWFAWFRSSCFYLISAIFCSLIWDFIPFNYLLRIIICLGITLILKLVFKILIMKRLKSWIIYHLLYGFLAHSLLGKKIGIKLFSLLLAVN